MPNNYERHQRAAEFHDMAAHAHLAAASSRDKQDHLTGSELSRNALEHSQKAHFQSEQAHRNHAFSHAEIAERAHQLWQARGCPPDSEKQDWQHALADLKSRANGL